MEARWCGQEEATYLANPEMQDLIRCRNDDSYYCM